ncbi:hypothetical protein TBR22_A49660 [Luteitalea sp. TBR-22]|uniref:LpqB family beta-propeller domain-containing protein n=1 Tax=Luteitalea sp. TBR-22 TaxID=2802971 RepID=UPI001AF7FD27|nr:LpqB family beta-propeller domain-containing protein [Luteitalea sp. TBR-22]BCS35732.1 hypothetical protein TBR22_A49660 [Luteitalea sp. TBR-22]
MKTRILMHVTTAALLTALSGSLAAQGPASSAQALLRTATDTEVVDGDPKRAIPQYLAIVERYGSTDRATAAQALLRAAEAYRKLGDPQAARAYQRLVAQYPDQPSALKVARTRLSATTAQATTTPAVRSLWSGADVDHRGRVSHDGRYLSGGDRTGRGMLMIRDLATGEMTRLTSGTKPYEYVEHSIFSPDDTRLAYVWLNERLRYDLRVIDRTGGQPRVLYELPAKGWMQPFDWSPDGRHIAVQVNTDGVQKLVLVSVADDAVRVLKTFDWRSPMNMSFSPDGRFIAYDHSPTDDGRARDVFVIAVDGSREATLVDHTAHDQVLGWFPDGKRLLITSDRSGSNDAYALDVVDGRAAGEPRLVKRDIDFVAAPMGFTRRGEFVYGIRPRSADVHIASIDPTTGRATAAERPVGGGFTGNRFVGTWSPDGASMAYLSSRPYQNNLRMLSVASTHSGEVRTVPVALNWFYPLVSWAPDGRHLILDGQDVKGRFGLQRVDLSSGRVELLLAADGADSANSSYPVVHSPDGRFLYLVTQSGHVTRREIATGATSVVAQGPIVTFALSRDGRTLAVVRRRSADGRAVDLTATAPSTDIIEVAPVDGGPARQVFTGSQLGQALAWAPDGQSIYVAQMPAGTVWRVPAAGGPAQELPMKVAGLTHISVHPDGRQIALSGRTQQREVLALDLRDGR